MIERLRWLAGPVATSVALLGLSLVLDGLFQRGLPPARAVSPALVAWLALAATLVVAGAWLLAAWRGAVAKRRR
jgi:hypothetical protein